MGRTPDADAAISRAEAHNRMGVALNALTAVRDLCIEAASGGRGRTMAHVDADKFACLLMFITDELNSAYENI